MKDKDAFGDATDYWLDYDPKAKVLTLHFTLPFKKPVKSEGTYDSKFTIRNFSSISALAEKNPVKLIGAPPQCAVWTEKPDDPHFSFVAEPQPDRSLPLRLLSAWALNFANNILVQCL